MNTAADIAAFFAKQNPNQTYIWQAFDRMDIEDSWGKMSDEAWAAVLRIFDKNPPTSEDFGVWDAIKYAKEKLGEED